MQIANAYPQAFTVVRLAAPPTVPQIGHWNESGARGRNHIADGAVVSVGAQTLSPLIWSIPGYRFTGGLATAHAGVEILAENGGVQTPQQTFAQISGLIDAAPVLAVKQFGQVIVEARQDTGYDAYFAKAYGIPGFQAVAASGGGLSTYFGGHVYMDGAFFHELGHIAEGLIDTSRWGGAISQDDANVKALLARGTLTVDQLGPVAPDPVRQARWTPTLAAGGVTPYAVDALHSGTAAEDIAESLRLRTDERYYGHAMATYHDNATGADRPIGFAELYPGRTRLLSVLGPALEDVGKRPGWAA